MTDSIFFSTKRSVPFWVLTLLCLTHALFMTSSGLYLSYKMFFGSTMQVLSERMGAETYKNFVSETLGISMVLVLGSHIALTLSMIFLIKEQYSRAKTLLAVFVLCTIFLVVIGFEKSPMPIPLSAIPLLCIPIGVISSLLWYIKKYRNEAFA